MVVGAPCTYYYNNTGMNGYAPSSSHHRSCTRLWVWLWYYASLSLCCIVHTMHASLPLLSFLLPATNKRRAKHRATAGGMGMVRGEGDNFMHTFRFYTHYSYPPPPINKLWFNTSRIKIGLSWLVTKIFFQKVGRSDVWDMLPWKWKVNWN